MLEYLSSEFPLIVPISQKSKDFSALYSLHKQAQYHEINFTEEAFGLFRTLPIEIVMHIFSFLDLHSAMALSRTNMDLFKLLHEDSIWQAIYTQYPWSGPDESANITSADKVSLCCYRHRFQSRYMTPSEVLVRKHDIIFAPIQQFQDIVKQYQEEVMRETKEFHRVIEQASSQNRIWIIAALVVVMASGLARNTLYPVVYCPFGWIIEIVCYWSNWRVVGTMCSATACLGNLIANTWYYLIALIAYGATASWLIPSPLSLLRKNHANTIHHLNLLYEKRRLSILYAIEKLENDISMTVDWRPGSLVTEEKSWVALAAQEMKDLLAQVIGIITVLFTLYRVFSWLFRSN